MDGASPGFGVGAVARRLGVAASTLRTWDRRYGIGPSQRSEGYHRRYDAVDVARLEMMHRLILSGLPPAEAARTALAASPDVPAPASRRRRLKATGSGGNRLVMPGAAPEARALSRAAMTMDEPATRELIRDALRRRGVVWAWENMLVPVLAGIGGRYSSTGRCIEIEHLLSWSALAALAAVAVRPGEAVNTRPVLLACAAEEQHTLPLHALAAALAKRHVATRVLGARVPYGALADAIRRLGPAAVFVWSQTAATGDPTPLADLPALRPAIRVIVGGPGWNRQQIPSGIHIARTLVEAVAAVMAALGMR